MKKHIMIAVLLPLLVIVLAGVCQAGQGEMDPYGLFQYGTAFLTYTGVTGWSYSLDQFNTVGTLIDYYDGAGEGERRNSADNVLKLLKMGKTRIEWSTDGGLSVLFDL